MNSRQLLNAEESVLNRFREIASDYALIYITKTGLSKSILDATTPVRTLLKTNGFHDFGQQGQGPLNKRKMLVNYLESTGAFEIETSLYRPATKEGDPRLWFSRLNAKSKPEDVLVIFVSKGKLYLANITQLSRVLSPTLDTGTWLERWIGDRRLETFSIALELLGELRRIASKGPLVATCKGDTAVGRAIETALGISMNSHKAPDYKGIEIKAKRLGGKRAKYTLFGQVPNWNLSGCKSTDEILTLLGYQRDGIDKLYCTVSTLKPNSQGMQFRILKEIEQLQEFTKSHANIAVWELDKLHERLLQKHPETFWVRAKSEKIKDVEHFWLLEVIHTRQPSVARFDEFLEVGIISMDHLIKRTKKRATDKGPLFRIWQDNLDDLFISESNRYKLS